MRNFEDIHYLILKSKLILIVNDNSKSITKSVIDNIYYKYPNKKIKIKNTKGLLRKISYMKDTLIRIDKDVKKVQFSSSNTTNKIYIYRFFDLIIVVEKQQIRVLKNRYESEQDNIYNIDKLVRKTKLKKLSLFSEKD